MLRLVGARDGWIARAFVRRITQRAFLGALFGSVAAALLLTSFPPAPQSPAVAPLPALRPTGLLWLSFGVLPLFAAATAFVTTRVSALRILKGRL